MKVKELIEQLQKLDQEKSIWIIYDCYLALKPEVRDGVLSEEDAEYYRNNGWRGGDYDVKAGDYAIIA
jgi:hypothetical protein